MDQDLWVLFIELQQGKFFPKYPGGLVAECSFHGHSLITQPAHHTRLNNVKWYHKFRFDILRKLLTKYKADRIPLKLNIYGVDNSKEKRMQLLGNICTNTE